MKKLILAFFAMFFLIGCGDDVEATSKNTDEYSVEFWEKRTLQATAAWNADRSSHALKEIRSYYMAGLRLEFGNLESMTSNHKNFEDSALKEKIKVGEPIKISRRREEVCEVTVK